MGFADVPQQHTDLWRYFHFRAGELWVEPLAPFSFLLLRGGMFAMFFLFRSNEILCKTKKFPLLLCTIIFLQSLGKKKKKVSKLHSQSYDLHSVYYTKIAAGVSCIATISVAVKREHDKEEMGTELAFTLGFFLELFICHICVWSSQ